MISEEQLQQYKAMANDYRYDGSVFKPIVVTLIAEVRRLKAQLPDSISQGFYHGKTIMEDKVVQLEKEADWLANKLTLSFCLSRQVKYKEMCKRCELHDLGLPIEGEIRGMMDNYTEQAKICWRESARKSVEGK